MFQIKLGMALTIMAGLSLLVGMQSDAFAQWSNDTAMGNATNASGLSGNATNATSPLNATSPVSINDENLIRMFA
jgi:hypothetical protein